jgi:hypothetical protein
MEVVRVDDRPEWERHLDEWGSLPSAPPSAPDPLVMRAMAQLAEQLRCSDSGGYSRRHFTETGHRLSFGCCA